MGTTKRKRLIVLTAGMVCALGIYFGAYFAFVTVQYGHSLVFKEQTMQEAYALYRLGPVPQDLARCFFKPAQLFDALYLRPGLWQDRKQAPTK